MAMTREEWRQALALEIGRTNPTLPHVYINGQDACLEIADRLIASGIIAQP